MIDIIGLMMLAEGEPKPNRRRTEATCGAPVARIGDWVGPMRLRIIRDQLNFHINQISFDAPIEGSIRSPLSSRLTLLDFLTHCFADSGDILLRPQAV